MMRISTLPITLPMTDPAPPASAVPPMTEAAIDPGFTRDLYVSLGDSVSDSAWVVRVYHKPFIDWIWGGCILMALGGALAASDRRYRFALKQRAETYASAPAA
jgi:cytochrome c-type biogenesis protein CcmF